MSLAKNRPKSARRKPRSVDPTIGVDLIFIWVKDSSYGNSRRTWGRKSVASVVPCTEKSFQVLLSKGGLVEHLLGYQKQKARF